MVYRYFSLLLSPQTALSPSSLEWLAAGNCSPYSSPAIPQTPRSPPLPCLSLSLSGGGGFHREGGGGKTVINHRNHGKEEKKPPLARRGRGTEVAGGETQIVKFHLLFRNESSLVLLSGGNWGREM